MFATRRWRWCRIGRTGPLAALAVAAVVALAVTPPTPAQGQDARHSAARQAAPPDPGGPGPYAVGVTRRTFTRASSTTGRDRTLDTVIWYPAATGGPVEPRLKGSADAPPDRTGGPYPIVLFSHGSGGVPAQSTFFTANLASHGFVVVAPPHPGNTAADCRDGCLGGDAAARAALLDSALNRPPDIVAAYDAVSALSAGADDPLLAGMVDPGRAGVAGHSFGGMTAVFVAARDGRFKAAVPMAPATLPSVRDEARTLKTPTMLLGGELDHLARIGGVESLFQAIPTPQPEHWLLTFPRGGHFAYADLCPAPAAGCGPDDLPQAKAHTLINRWAGAFLLRYVAGDTRYGPLIDPAAATDDPDLTVVRAP